MLYVLGDRIVFKRSAMHVEVKEKAESFILHPSFLLRIFLLCVHEYSNLDGL